MLLPPPITTYKLKVVKSFVKNIGIRAKYFIEESVKKYIQKTLKKVIVMSISGSLVMQSLILSPIFMGALTTQSNARSFDISFDFEAIAEPQDIKNLIANTSLQSTGPVSANNWQSCLSVVSSDFYQNDCKVAEEVNVNQNTNISAPPKPQGFACKIGDEVIYIEEDNNEKSLTSKANMAAEHCSSLLAGYKMQQQREEAKIEASNVNQPMDYGKKCEEEKLNYGYLDNQVVYGADRFDETGFWQFLAPIAAYIIVETRDVWGPPVRDWLEYKLNK